MTPAGSPGLLSPLRRPASPATGAILWVSCGPACVVSTRASGHAGTSRRLALASRFRADRRRPCSHTFPAGELIRGPQREGLARACAGSPESWPRPPAACWPPPLPSRPPSRGWCPPPGGQYGTTNVAPVPATTVRVITTGGMAGWQITSIALGAALFAAAAGVLLYRALTARKAASAAIA